jgi:ATP-dependent DNA helicase RecQ
MIDKARLVLKKYYGYSSFREGQEKIITAITQGSDTLGIMPTGGGKSICFQVPALLYPGTTLVISPLISLMKDQVDSLITVGIPATFINSSLSAKEVHERLRAAKEGQYKLLYVAPERLESEHFRELLKSLTISILAVDEAHCISQWGHDFRPSYRSIAKLIQELPKRPVVTAFTATATEAVTKDIAKQLALNSPTVVVTGFDRKNLSFAVSRSEDKRSFLLRYLKRNQEQAGIIYAATRKEVEGIYEYLHKRGFAVGKYHAGVGDAERTGAQEAFLYDDIRIMVATNAFGMGIDKSNVRFVIHYNMPKNMESYYQEAGRAGRDGEDSECFLLFSPQDIQIQKFLIEQTHMSPERKAQEYKKLQIMMDYCHTPRCLRKYILDYFGEENVSETCNNCSNCNNTGELRDITQIAQKIFSCIMRMREVFGLTMVAEVLKGSNNKKVLQNRFHTLSTYGLLKEYTLKEITELMKVLVAEGYIHLTESQYPVAKLTPKAVIVLKNEAKVFRKMEPARHKSEGDNTLFEELRRLRKEIAQQASIPPYVVFPDTTLSEMSKHLPLDEEALLGISGVGEVKLQKYGSLFLTVIRKYVEAQGMQPLPSSKADKSSKLKDIQESTGTAKEVDKNPSYLLTYNLFQQGKSLEGIARERDLSIITVQEHIVRSSLEGYKVDWDALISPEHEQLILAAIERLGAEKLKPLKEALPDEIEYFALRGVICKHNSK